MNRFALFLMAAISSAPVVAETAGENSGFFNNFLSAQAAEENIASDKLVVVNEPYMELHTGPGRGYPVFHVVAKDESVKVLARRTNWFKVETQTRRPISGWVRHKDMLLTLNSDGYPVGFSDDDTDPFDAIGNRFEWSISGGDFNGASSISTALAYKLTKNIAVELQGTQLLGDFSDGLMVTASVQHTPFPHLRFSPYFQLGAGLLRTEPHATIVQAEDRTDNTLIVGTGINMRLSRRFNLFIDYRHHTLLTSRDENEEIDEWKLGFNVYF